MPRSIMFCLKLIRCYCKMEWCNKVIQYTGNSRWLELQSLEVVDLGSEILVPIFFFFYICKQIYSRSFEVNLSPVIWISLFLSKWFFTSLLKCPIIALWT
jgi:fucose 4-O-acetylase-like acetyltransferase